MTVREINGVRGLTLNGDRIIRACNTGYSASPEFCPRNGDNLIVAYALNGNNLVFQLTETNPHSLESGNTCYVQGSVEGLRRDGINYFDNNCDVLRVFNLSASTLRNIVLNNAPKR